MNIIQIAPDVRLVIDTYGGKRSEKGQYQRYAIPQVDLHDGLGYKPCSQHANNKRLVRAVNALTGYITGLPS